MLYIFPCSVSLPSQSVQLLFIFFCFQYSIQIFIRTSLCHRNCLLCLALLFFVDLFTFFISYFVPYFLCLFLFFYAVLNFLIPPPCLLSPFRFPNVTLSTVSAAFFSISFVLSNSSGNRSLPPSILVTSCLNAS